MRGGRIVAGVERHALEFDFRFEPTLGAATISSTRVLHVINQFTGRAGAEVSLRETVLSSLDGPLVHGVVVLRGEGNVLGELQAAGIPVFVPEGSSPGRMEAVAHVRRAIKAFGPDLVHTSLFDADVAGRIAAWTMRTPTLTSFVNTPYGPEAAGVEPVRPWKRHAVRLVDRVLARFATSAFHAISDATAGHAVHYLGVDKGRIRVVPRGRSAAALGERSEARRDAVRQRLSWGAYPIVLNVARQEPQKGHTLLVEAFAEVLAAHPDARLALVGREGRSTSAIRQRIAQLGIADSVKHLGVRTDVADLLAAADVFAFSSLYEGLGGAAVEAAGAAIPLVSFDIPAVREIVGDTHPWLVAPGDVVALAGAIRDVIDDPPRAARVAAEQRARFLARYELSTAVAAMTTLYQDVHAAAQRSSGSWLRRVTRLPRWA